MSGYSELRRLIVSGGLAGPNRITESAIADLLAVSRTPVREALQARDAASAHCLSTREGTA